MQSLPLRELERLQRIRRYARQLANQGRCANWRDVLSILTREGRRDEPEALASPFVRIALDARCALAKFMQAGKLQQLER